MRLLNRVLAALLCLALMAASVILIIEVIAQRTDNQPVVLHWHTMYQWADRTIWQAGSLRVAFAICLVVGLILLAAELKPPRVKRLRVAPSALPAAGTAAGADVPAQDGAGEQAPVDAAYTRRGVTEALRSAVTEVDGVDGAKVKVSRRSVRVSATANATDRAAADHLHDSVEQAARSRLDDLQLESGPTLKVHTSPRSR